MFFLSRQRYARAFPQELHIISEFWGDFDEINAYKKVSDRCIIINEAI